MSKYYSECLECKRVVNTEYVSVIGTEVYCFKCAFDKIITVGYDKVIEGITYTLYCQICGKIINSEDFYTKSRKPYHKDCVMKGKEVLEIKKICSVCTRFNHIETYKGVNYCDTCLQIYKRYEQYLENCARCNKVIYSTANDTIKVKIDGKFNYYCSEECKGKDVPENLTTRECTIICYNCSKQIPLNESVSYTAKEGIYYFCAFCYKKLFTNCSSCFKSLLNIDLIITSLQGEEVSICKECFKEYAPIFKPKESVKLEKPVKKYDFVVTYASASSYIIEFTTEYYGFDDIKDFGVIAKSYDAANKFILNVDARYDFKEVLNYIIKLKGANCILGEE